MVIPSLGDMAPTFHDSKEEADEYLHVDLQCDGYVVEFLQLFTLDDECLVIGVSEEVDV